MDLESRPEPLATALPRGCDVCHQQAAVRWLDYDLWACADCARLYLTQLQLKG